MFRAMSLAALTLLPAAALAAEDAASLRLVPFPKEVRLESGTFSLDRPLVVEAPPEVLAQVGEAFGAECRRAGLRAPQLKPAAGTGNALRLAPSAGAKMPAVAFRQGAGEEDYALDIRSGAAVVTGHGPAGLFYGVQTLCQLVRANRRGKGLPCLTVRDWPSLRWRAFQDDLTRGPSSTLEELKREAALGATLKMNVFTYYMEHQFAFKKHPEIGPPDGSLTPEDLRSLVEFCRPLHTDVLGNQQSFGHFYNILKHDAYKPLGENAWILSPVNEGSYQLLDDLYSEVIPRLPGPFFNVCCDETQGLGEGASKELAKQIGVGGVYARHIRRVHDLVHGKYGKRMMMWGDIILGHPDNLKEIPKDTVMLTWGYDPRANFESQILPFARSGYEFFVCPGVNNWSRILPDFGDATTNIGNFTRDGAKHGALGFLNTSWDDDGETLNGPNWHGFAWGAECAWNASATPPDAFNRRIGAVLFGEQGDRFGQAIGLLSGAHRLPGMQGMMDSRFWDLDLGPLKSTIAAARTDAEKLLALSSPPSSTCRPAAKRRPPTRRSWTPSSSAPGAWN